MIVKKNIEINLDEMMSDYDYENNWDFIDSKVCEEYVEDCICEEIPYAEDVEDDSEGLR